MIRLYMARLLDMALRRIKDSSLSLSLSHTHIHTNSFDSNVYYVLAIAFSVEATIIPHFIEIYRSTEERSLERKN